MTVPIHRCALGAATCAAMILASAAPALATTRHHGPPRHQPAAAAAHFDVHGLVVAVTGNKVKVLSHVAKVGKTAVHNKVVTLTLTPKTHKISRARTRPAAQRSPLRAAALVAPAASAAPAVAVGDDINATGTVLSTGELITTSETSMVLPAEALVGSVSAVNTDGSFIVATHDQVDGDHAEHDDNSGTLVVATGVAPVGPALAVGQYIVVPGESEDHLMTAAKMYTFTAAPALAAGRVTAADATARTLTVDPQGNEHDGQEHTDDQDGSSSTILLDATSADILINGATPTRPAFPSAGDEVLTVGTAGASPSSLTAILILDFNAADNGTVQDNQNHQDGGNR